MKLSSVLLWSSLLATLAPEALAQANTIPDQPHLLVKGEARREVMPDRFTLQLTLAQVDMDADTARAKVQEDAARVLTLFKKHGAVAGSVRADNLDIGPAHRYEQAGPVFIGTRVSRRLKGSFASPQAMQGFLGALNASDTLQVSSLAPGYSDVVALRRELKGEAAAQTRHSARALATAYGARIRGLYSISDVAPSFAYGVQAGQWPTDGASVIAETRPTDLVTPPAPPAPQAPYTRESIEAGPITYTENVYAIFLISDGT
ncbi:SIMPL domain-containing protein [Stenotrophomonas sp. WHRI 8082]|uniref:SIMPL domain-containing protein n=1 Tax=Stenotrophomonas sp. WHRI 8082 TaxID=3162571 RepID=UPI0032EDFA89